MQGSGPILSPEVVLTDKTWADLEFESKKEENDCRSLQRKLHKDYDIPLSKLPPFEIQRFYLGSNRDIDRAIMRWTTCIEAYKKFEFKKLCKESNLQNIVESIHNINNTMQCGNYTNNGSNELICSLSSKGFHDAPFDLSDNNYILAQFIVFTFITSSNNLNHLRNGMIILFNFDHFSLSKVLSKTSITQVVSAFALLVKACPLFFSRMVVINSGAIVRFVYGIVKSFMSKAAIGRMSWMTQNEFDKKCIKQFGISKDKMASITLGGTYTDPLIVEKCVQFVKSNKFKLFDHFNVDI